MKCRDRFRASSIAMNARQLTTRKLVACVLVCFSLGSGAEAEIESRFATVGNLRLQYVDWGGKGEPLVFIPGGCDTAFVFSDAAELLAQRYRVLGLTPRGCGASDRPVEGYDMDHQIGDILGFIDGLGIERVTLIGHSSGGGKITQFARKYPDRVGRLVYLDTVLWYVAPGLEEKIDAEIRKVTGGRPMDSADQWKRSARLWEPGARSPALDRDFEETFEIQSDGRLKLRYATPARWRQEIDRDMQSGLYFDTHITHAALMIFAMDTDRDRARQFNRQAQRELAPLIEDTEEHRREEIREFRSNGNHVHVIEMRHTAHYCFVQRPAEVSRLIISFLGTTVR